MAASKAPLVPAYRAAIILCGGLSQRMGYSKAWLPFGEETMLQRVVRLASSAVETIVVVQAAGQNLPALQERTIIATDAHPERGPLEGLLAGLKALPEDVTAAFVTSCDVPLLSPAFIGRMFDLVESFDVVVSVEDSFLHPLSAVYRPTVIPQIERLLNDNRRRVMDLFDLARTKKVDAAQFTDIDPSLGSIHNVNTPTDYFAAAATAGIEIPQDVRRKLNSETRP